MVMVQPQRIYGDAPQQIECPYCHQLIITTVQHGGGILMWILVVACCLFWLVINQTRQHLAERCNLRSAKFGYCHVIRRLSVTRVYCNETANHEVFI